MWTKFSKNGDFYIDGLYTAYIRNVESGMLFPGEAHDFWEMMYCSKGSAVICKGEKIIQLNDSQIVFFKPMEFHSFRVEKDVKSEFFIASFGMVGKLAEKFADEVFYMDHHHTRIIGDIITTIKGNIDNISEKKDDNFLEEISNIPYAVNTLTNMFENFMISLSKIGAAPYQLVKTHETAIYSKALTVIEEHLGNKMTVEELAKNCNVSSTYLKSIFKKFSGLCIHEYVLKTKINLVKRMLAEGQTVTEISQKLGFASQNYLSTAFKRETGLSPSEYKSNK